MSLQLKLNDAPRDVKKNNNVIGPDNWDKQISKLI